MRAYLIPILILVYFVSCQVNEPKDEQVSAEIKNADTTLVDSGIAEGEKLFKGFCMSCHSIQDKVIGPALKDIDSIDRQWLYSWVRDNQALIHKGDKRANKIFQEYSMMLQPPFDLNDKQIDNIVKYVSSKKRNK